MLPSLAVAVAALALQCQYAYAKGANDQVNANIDYGTFQNPSNYVRPRFRYWAPDASVNMTQVAEDVREAGRVGVGGVELLAYYLYGDVQLFPGNYDALESDWTVNYFGSPAWSESQRPIGYKTVLTLRCREVDGCRFIHSLRRRTCSRYGLGCKSRSRRASPL
jgi:hypothetical protein